MAVPATQAEKDRVDGLARKADQAFDARQKAGKIMTDEEAQRRAERLGLAARRSHRCDRSAKTRRATNIRVSCQLWKVRAYHLPRFGWGESVEDAVYGRTWEDAFRRRAVRDVEQRLRREKVGGAT